MSYKFMGWAWKQIGLSPIERNVLLFLADQADGIGCGSLDISKIANRLELDVPILDRTLTDMKTKGLFSFFAVKSPAGEATIQYQLNLGEKE